MWSILLDVVLSVFLVLLLDKVASFLLMVDLGLLPGMLRLVVPVCVILVLEVFRLLPLHSNFELLYECLLGVFVLRLLPLV